MFFSYYKRRRLLRKSAYSIVTVSFIIQKAPCQADKKNELFKVIEKNELFKVITLYMVVAKYRSHILQTEKYAIYATQSITYYHYRVRLGLQRWSPIFRVVQIAYFTIVPFVRHPPFRE